MGGDLGEETPILSTPNPPSSSSSSSSLHLDLDGSALQQGHLKRTGTSWSAVAHIITGVIGAGVLSLAWSTAQLGWIAGPLCILGFAAVTLVNTYLLCDCYRFPDSEYGPNKNRSYMGAVRSYLGERSHMVCGVFVQESLYGNGIAYTIVAASSIRAILRSDCYHREGHEAPCSYPDTSFYMFLFGAAQILMSQIPDMHNMLWVSVIATVMSFTYSFIGFALGFAKVVGDGEIKGSISGVPAANTADKLWIALEAIGDVAFAYPFSVILLEIQDTLKSPPPENKTMKKASTIAVSITTLFYLCCACFGYAAFGNNTPGNLLTGFGFYEPYWLVDLANACIVIHLIGGYQIYSQPQFAFVESWISEKCPESSFVNDFYIIKLPSCPPLRINFLRICFRSAYVVSTTTLAMLFPYFNQVLGVLGALNFWPLTIYFPVEMYLVHRKIGAWTRKWIVLKMFSFTCLLIAAMALMGSVERLVSAKFITKFS